MILAHQIALDLTEEQAHYCRRAAGTARFTYNWGLAEWQRQYRAGEKPTALHVKGMLRNHCLARAISDMGFGTFRRLLTYKAERAGVRLVVADRWFPSSKLCSRCGVLHETLTLKDRIFSCQACGLVIDRDLNAALNLSTLPWASGESTPVDTAALATVSDRRETAVGEAGTTESALLCTF